MSAILRASASARLVANAAGRRVGGPSSILRRGVQTFSVEYPKTKTTTLPNGLTVATESSPLAQTATVGVWIDAGSRAEHEYNNGTAHFLEHLAFKGTTSRSQQQLELEIENLGAHLNAYTSRENTVFYAKALKDDVPKSVEILSDILQNSKLEEQAIERERDVIIRESEEVDKQYEEVVFDHLHAVAFQGQPLGRTILGPRENILEISKTELSNYIKYNYKADRMVLAGAGAVDHDALVKLAEKHFAGLPTSGKISAPGTGSKAANDIPKFVGSEVRIRDDTLPVAHIAIAVEGVSWSSPDYYTALVAQAIIGNWDRAQGSAFNQSSKLSAIVSQNHLANSYLSFSTSYSDTGLWGIYLTTENKTQIDDLVHFTLKEWNRLSISVSDAEVERAKSQLKASLLLSLDSTTAVAEDIGRQIITTGRRQSPQEVERNVSKVTVNDVKQWAQKYLYDKDIAIAALGPIEGLLDYQRIRNDMSMMRW
ncbi:Mas1p [Sugiyamaella lignohabitans]|uniref:mitochondrial processing peptidase n=1 Tax=Sugiyamaella lignohabitans TaxID=796027 RepID=A0A167DMF4_9ASCO|nr:Mas1p [Sugiyamaella lignohabitans]ANB13070.1 Mas1p [Sugiyamaella lignohabitans]